MSVQIISQSLSDIALNLTQGNTSGSDFFLYGLPSPLPFYGLQTNTLRTSDTIGAGQQCRLVLPTTGLLAPSPLIVRWSDTITRSSGSANTGFSTYNVLFCWRTIELRSASNPIYSLTPHAILNFMSYTLSPNAYSTWLAMISSVTLADGATQDRTCVLPLLLPGFTDSSNLLDLRRSQSNYDLVFTMAPVTEWAGSLATSVAQQSGLGLQIDYNWIELSEADEKNYVENTYLKSDSSLTKGQLVLHSEPRTVYAANTAYPLTKARLVEQIHFFFATAAAPTNPVDVVAGLVTPTVTDRKSVV